MSVSFLWRNWAVGMIVGAIGLGVLGSPVVTGSHPAVAPAGQTPGEVQRVTRDTPRVAAKPGEKGATYYALEFQSRRVTTEFQDGTKSVAERAIDGTIKASLKDVSGNDIHRVRVDRLDDATNAMAFLPASSNPVVVRVPVEVHTTLDWANHQAHKLFQDRAGADTPLQWRDGIVRSKAAAVSRASGLDGDVRMIHTEWANGLAAKTMRVKPQPGYKFEGRLVTGDVLTTKLLKNGVDIGVANYFIEERIFVWHLQGVPDGSIAAEHLKSRYGGWVFTPDLIWMNLQTIAKYSWWSAIAAQGSVAENRSCRPPSEGVVARMTGFFVPTVFANDPGCDGLHWLDGTIFRYCCDVHDYCYEKYGCDSSSWWRWFSSWTCDYCNMNAAWCFVGAAGAHPPFVPCPC
jgi:hypothetical protein